jgi:SAM-dependent methyltransferase
MSVDDRLEKVKEYFARQLVLYGTTPQGVDFSSVETHETRFAQLIKIFGANLLYSLLDFGSGFGAFYDYLIRLGHHPNYVGYDISLPMVEKGRTLHAENPACRFTTDLADVPVLDYATLCGTFNMKLDADDETWTKIVVECLQQMDAHASRGFSFNMLTKYSDPEKMRPDLYYADPLFFFDYCKRNFSKNVALLHDYKLYDFTILVRKD